MLALPHDDKPFVVDIDTNTEQLGCVLLKEKYGDSLRPVAYFRQVLNDGKGKYDTTEPEREVQNGRQPLVR